MNTTKNCNRTNGFGELIDQIFNHTLVPMINDEAKPTTRIPVNIEETDASFILHMMAPGWKREDFNISVEKNLLNISAEVKNTTEEPTANWVRKEFTQRSFKRSFSLTDKVDSTKVSAKYEEGILYITIAKQAPVAPTTIKISVD